MKRIIISNVDLMSADEEEHLLYTLNQQNIEYKILFK